MNHFYDHVQLIQVHCQNGPKLIYCYLSSSICPTHPTHALSLSLHISFYIHFLKFSNVILLTNLLIEWGFSSIKVAIAMVVMMIIINWFVSFVHSGEVNDPMCIYSWVIRNGPYFGEIFILNYCFIFVVGVTMKYYWYCWSLKLPN